MFGDQRDPHSRLQPGTGSNWPIGARGAVGRLAVLERGWASLAIAASNMFTLIGLGTGAAFLYSVVATLFRLFPPSFRDIGGSYRVL